MMNPHGRIPICGDDPHGITPVVGARMLSKSR